MKFPKYSILYFNHPLTQHQKELAQFLKEGIKVFVLDDFDYAVITGSIVYNAGIDPSTALLQEDILPHLILQVVVKEENKDAQWAKDIVAAYHSDEFKEYLDKNNNGLWFVPEELFN